MARILSVYLNRDLVGTLLQDDDGEMTFNYELTWLECATSMPLSHSLPLQKEVFSRKQCRGFFAGLLPEEEKRELVARNLGISSKNDFSMLEKIGGECAGAITFLPPNMPFPENKFRYRKLSTKELAAILKELPGRPLLAGDQDIRLSLAGAQDKIPLYVAGGHPHIPLDSAPSSHILKPGNSNYEGLIYNEAFCLALAKSIGLHVVKAEIGKAEDIDYLLVERYDRVESVPFTTLSGQKPITMRMHQEDFCQALGVPPEKKYQAEEGPSLKQCFALLREISTAPVVDIQRLLDAVIFNFLIGNHDAHGKNFSLIYNKGHVAMDHSIRLAPLYDLVSTVYYPDLTKKMAMKIGGEYESDKILSRHFELLAEEAGLAKPIVKKRVPEMAQAVLVNLGNVNILHPTAQAVAELIRKRCEESAA